LREKLNILVTGAGGGGSNNLIHSLRKMSFPVEIIGTNASEFWLARSTADKNYLIPWAGSGEKYLEALNYVIRQCDVGLIIPNNDNEAVAVSESRDSVETRTFLPSPKSVRTFRDKFALHEALERIGVRTARTVVVEDLSRLPEYFEKIGSPRKVWVRQRRASGSRGSLPVSKPEEAEFWIRYWNSYRGVAVDEFTVSEFLPGRDFACQSIWNQGELVIAKTCERIEYLFGENMPAGTSSSPRVGRLCVDERVNDICQRAIGGIDPSATGVFAMDLKEDEDGNPCVTEINNGRFFMITPVFNLVGRHNMAEIYVKLALNEGYEVEPSERFTDVGEETIYLLRSVDHEPIILTESELEQRFQRVAPS